MAFLGLLVTAELVLRLGLGLGHPPLYVTDAHIEYLLKPNQSLTRFGKAFSVNEFGMRSPRFDSKRSNAKRIMIVGDSIVNGGSMIDQRELATEQLSEKGFEVLNISAGSWGPENMLAYLRRFGTFGSERMILVLSAHDAWDVPTFEPLDPNTHPIRNPPLAIIEVVQRYLPRFIPGLASSELPEDQPPQRSALDAVEKLVSITDQTCVILHSRKGLAENFSAIRSRIGNTPYVVDDKLTSPSSFIDDIHMNPKGQRELLKALEQCMAFFDRQKT